MFEVSFFICILVVGVCISFGGLVNKDRYFEGKNVGRDVMYYLCFGFW